MNASNVYKQIICDIDYIPARQLVELSPIANDKKKEITFVAKLSDSLFRPENYFDTIRGIMKVHGYLSYEYKLKNVLKPNMDNHITIKLTDFGQ